MCFLVVLIVTFLGLGISRRAYCGGDFVRIEPFLRLRDMTARFGGGHAVRVHLPVLV
jgi:hypothetical protein